MFSRRLVRLVLFIAFIGLMIFAAQHYRVRLKSAVDSGDTIASFQPKEEVKWFGEKVLGMATKILPSEILNFGVNQDTETFLRNQTDQILETVKHLPAAEAEKIKKELIRDFCQRALND